MNIEREALYTVRWYLNNAPGDTEGIQSAIARGLGDEDSSSVVESSGGQGTGSLIPSLIPWHSLRDAQIAVMPGHEPGGGAAGEREWNSKVADHLTYLLEEKGANVFNYRHVLRAYSARQRDMRVAVNRTLPKCQVCLELHFDAVDDDRPKGHHFQYREAKGLASAIRDHWQHQFPISVPRRDNGIYENRNDRGSGFLRQSPGYACLTEPFFRSNDGEWDYFKNRHDEVALVYAKGVANFLDSL